MVHTSRFWGIWLKYGMEWQLEYDYKVGFKIEIRVGTLVVARTFKKIGS